MGLNKKLLAEKKIELISNYDPGKHCIEWTNDAFHIHWRNMLLYLSKEELFQFLYIAQEAFKKWKELGQPDIRKDSLNVGLAGSGGLSINHDVHKDYFAIEQLADNYYHLHYRSFRMDLSKKEILEFCNVMEEARRSLLTDTGKEINMTTDEYINKKTKSKEEITEENNKTILKNFFNVLKKQNVNYVVMRWFSTLPEKLHPIHNDVDLLVSDEDYHLIPKIFADDDIRTVSCGYFPKEKAEEMLKNPITLKGNIQVPNLKNYFLSMSYHCLYHKFLDSGVPTNIEGFTKNTNITDYLNEIKFLANHFGYKDKEITLEYLHQILKKEGWFFEENAPSGVIHNLERLKEFIGVVDNNKN